MYRSLALGLVGCQLLWLMPYVLANFETRQDGDGQTIEDKLTSDEANDRISRYPHKVHPIKMEAGKVYVIELKGKKFDAFLRLEDAKGKHLAHNDNNEGKGSDARLYFKATEGGTYNVVATAANKNTGDYVLTVKLSDEDAMTAAQEATLKSDKFGFLIGKTAPEIECAHSFNGEVKKLSDLKGKVVFVDFWAVWCPPCVASFPHLRHLSEEFKKDGLEVLGVTTYFKGQGLDKEIAKLDGKDKDGNKLTPLSQENENELTKDFTNRHKLTHTMMMVSNGA